MVAGRGRRIASRLFMGLCLLIAISLAVFEYRQQQGRDRAERLLTEFTPVPLGNIGTTKRLRILPLLEFSGSHPDLLTEVGVSYLVDTDDHRILYDVGQNSRGLVPSPLERNMATLGIGLETIDTVFISHNHLDHVGGLHWQSRNTFSLGTEQRAFPTPRTQLIVPGNMSYPGMNPVIADQPTRVGEAVGSTGLASTGSIGRQLAAGWIEEHSLVVIVEGLGGVIIVACGHQPLPNLLARYDETFDAPLYGILGGLHFPVPQGRIMLGPLDVQRQLASGKGLFSPLDMAEVERQIAMLEERKLGLVGVSPHDSSDEVIARISATFGDRYRHIRTGEPIVIQAP